MKIVKHHYKVLVLFYSIIFMLLPITASFAREPPSHKELSYLQTSTDEYIIGPGDSLGIMVWKEPDLSRSYSVRIDGRISIPLIGDIKVSGETIAGLMKVLTVKFKEVVTDPEVSVVLNESKSWRYYVVGQVRQSGEFSLDYPISIVQAIAKCGGFLEWAKKDAIKVIRAGKMGKTIVTFNFEALSEKDDLDQDILLSPGDTILVP